MMSSLLLDLRANETLLINGAALSFPTRTRVVLKTKARFLFGKQIMAPEEATTPLRRIYFALQTAYVGDDAQRQPALRAARSIAAQLDAASIAPEQRRLIDEALRLAEAGEHFAALKLARQTLHPDETPPSETN